MAKVAAYDVKLKNGQPDSSTIFSQDTIIFDLNAATETHLHKGGTVAIKQRYMGTIMAAVIAKTKPNGSITADRAADSGLVNGYNAAHYQVIEKSGMGTGTRDIWITHDLQAAPSIWVIGSYLNYTPGYPYFTKLLNTGASGVVVKSQSSFTHQGLQYTMNLISVDTRSRVSPHIFEVPSSYTLIDRSNFMP